MLRVQILHQELDQMSHADNQVIDGRSNNNNHHKKIHIKRLFFLSGNIFDNHSTPELDRFLMGGGFNLSFDKSVCFRYTYDGGELQRFTCLFGENLEVFVLTQDTKLKTSFFFKYVDICNYIWRRSRVFSMVFSSKWQSSSDV